MVKKYSQSLTLALFASTIFLSAFLLFQVQPIMGKFILPWFGGSPGVWTTCMLVFQVLLFAGYGYAHLLTKRVSLAKQPLVHAGLMLVALCTLPITPTADWKPSGSESPTNLILMLLLVKVGLPYFLLSSTGPLLQAWISRTGIVAQPYRLYALSNVGSLLALISFPFVFEPALSSTQQTILWSLAFAAFVVLCVATGLYVRKQSSQANLNIEVHSPVTSRGKDLPRTQTTWPQVSAWFALSMLPSVLLLATTNQVCLDTAVIPFLWVLPLAIYLVSFILTFESERWYLRRPFIMLSTVAFIGVYAIKLPGVDASLPVELACYFGALFFSCMVAHGELVRLKPDAGELTRFYLTISAGGACGGLFVGFVAPQLFRGYDEFPLALFACVLLFLCVYFEKAAWWQSRIRPSGRVGIIAALLCSFTAWMSYRGSHDSDTFEAQRSFYGVLRVKQQMVEGTSLSARMLVHGRVVHGSQFSKPELVHQPTTYYSPTSGIGQLLQNFKHGQPRRIGVVGLGAGTLAVYGTDQDHLRFYEINSDVVTLAKKYFTFMSDSPAKVETILGDARLVLERESPQHYDVLVLDAFSGDAVPVHLLTCEAMEIYSKHLQDQGVMAIHISNLYFNLQAVVAGLAKQFGFETRTIINRDEVTPGALTSGWVLLARDAQVLDDVTEGKPLAPPPGKPIVWTDDRSNLFEALR